ELRDKKKIKDKANLCDDDHIKFVVKGMERPSVRQLHLRSKFGLNNMTLLNEDYRPVHFINTNQVLEWFFSFRLKFYPKRKELLLRQMLEKIQVLYNKYRLIRLVLSSPATFLSQPWSVVQPILEKEGIPLEMVKKIKLPNLMREDITKIEGELHK